MSKKVAVPLMLLSLGIFAVTQTAGCGSSNGGGGTGGAKADGGGTGGKIDAGGTDAGTGGRGTGGAGVDAAIGTGGRIDSGTDVVTGTGGRIDAGPDVTGTGGAAPDAPVDMAPVDAPADVPAAVDVRPDLPFDNGPTTTFDGAADASGQTRAAILCPGYSIANGRMTPEDFCSIFVALCSGTVDAGDCIARYTASLNTRMTDASGYGTIGTCESVHVCNVFNIDGGAGVHCPHAAGTALCLPAP